MKYTDEQIIQHAERYVARMQIQRGMRIVFGFMCAATIALPLLWLACLKDRFTFDDYRFLLDQHFLAGVAAGVGLAGWFAVCIIGTLRMFMGTHGIDMATFQFVARKRKTYNMDNVLSEATSQ